MSVEVLLSILKGYPLPDCWVFVRYGRIGAFITEEVKEELANHPVVLRYAEMQKEKARTSRVRSFVIGNTPKEWGIG